MNEKSLSPENSFKLDRCKALADGVFAIVITLLVLGIDIPPNHSFSQQGFWLFLEKIGFKFFFYAISFWLSVTYWIQHTAIMHYFRYGNRTLIWLNTLLLFPITILPFVTSLKGAYRFEFFVNFVFGSVQILIGLALIMLWRYAYKNPDLLHRKIDEGVYRKVLIRMWISPVFICFLAIFLFLISVRLSGFCFLSTPLFYLSFQVLDKYHGSLLDGD